MQRASSAGFLMPQQRRSSPATGPGVLGVHGGVRYSGGYAPGAGAYAAPLPPTHMPPMKPTFAEGSILDERDSRGRIVGRYRIGGYLGRGGFATCYEARDIESGAVWAVKVIERAVLIKTRTLPKLQSEIAIHRRMHHRCIVKFHSTFQDDWNVYILLEKCSNQTLMELSKARRRLTVPETQHFMLQSLQAVDYMHQNNVIHRDLKLGNIMLDSEYNIKVGDFGLATELQYDGERKRTICGTPNYIAPEILDGAHRNGHSFEVDVWSLGVIFYTMLVGEPPFQTNDVHGTYSRIRQCRYAFPPNVDVPAAAKDLIHRILQSRPEERPSLTSIRSHPFFSSPPPPTSAPLTLFSRREAERRAAMATGAAQVAPAPAAAPPVPMPAPQQQAQSAREVLRPLSHNGLVPPSAGTKPQVPSVPAYTARSSSAGPAPLAGGLGGRVQLHPQPPTAPTSSRPSTAVAAPTATHADNDDADVRAAHDELHRTLCGNPDAAPAPPSQAAAPLAPVNANGDVVYRGCAAPEAWVTHYADFTSKYGMAYRMSTGHTGVCFNDYSKIIWDQLSNNAEYYSRERHASGQIMDVVHPFSMDAVPESERYERERLAKKVTLAKYFRTYMRGTRRQDGVDVVPCNPYPEAAIPAPLLSDPHVTSNMVFVKRWTLTNDGQVMVFRMSNRTLQVCFLAERVEVLLASESRVVSYVGADGRRTTLPLPAVTSHSEEISRRVIQTKEILSRLITNREI